MFELWRNISGYPGYQVSSLGRVKSTKMKAPKILKQKQTTNGYLSVCLCNHNIKKDVFVHRLVAAAFIPNPCGKLTVNHLNEDKADNRSVNLSWATHKENIEYGSGLERRAQTRSKPVAQFTRDGTLLATYYGQSEASRQTGISQTLIGKCARGKRNHTHGYVWRFCDD